MAKSRSGNRDQEIFDQKRIIDAQRDEIKQLREEQKTMLEDFAKKPVVDPGEWYKTACPHARIVSDTAQAMSFAFGLNRSLIPKMAIKRIGDGVGSPLPELRKSALHKFVDEHTVRGSLDPSIGRVAMLIRMCDVLDTIYLGVPESKSEDEDGSRSGPD